jgi:hypothetical protein
VLRSRCSAAAPGTRYAVLRTRCPGLGDHPGSRGVRYYFIDTAEFAGSSGVSTSFSRGGLSWNCASKLSAAASVNFAVGSTRTLDYVFKHLVRLLAVASRGMQGFYFVYDGLWHEHRNHRVIFSVDRTGQRCLCVVALPISSLHTDN